MKNLLILITLLVASSLTFATDYNNPSDPVYTPTETGNRCNEFIGDTSTACQDYNKQAKEAGCVGLTDEAMKILNDKNLIAGCVFKNFKLQFTFSCKCGCFAPNTNILTSDGDVLVDEIVAAPDMYGIHAFGEDGSYKNEFNDVVDVTKGDNLEPMVSISAGGHSVQITASHPVLLADGTVVKASDLSNDSILMLAGGDEVTIDTIDKNVAYYGRVYNFSTGTKESDMADHIVSANGILMGDLYLQNALNKDSAAVSARQ